MLAGNGGPVYEPFRFDASFQVREDRFAAEKQRIARAAAALVQENETVGFAAGTTTTTLVARQLLHRKNISVITNAVNIGMELSSSTRLQTTLLAAACAGPAPSRWLVRWPSSRSPSW